MALAAGAEAKSRKHAAHREPPAPQRSDKDLISPDEMKNAVPLNHLERLPSTSEQYQALQKEIAKSRPAVESAKQKSETLAAEAADLRHRLIATAARVQSLEEEKGEIDAQLVKLTALQNKLSAQFAHDRVRVVRLLAVLERLQSDMPPVLALNANDALSAARGSMVLGASLPRIYGAAAALSKKLRTIQATHDALVAKRAEGVRNALQLRNARIELDQLLAMKSRAADAASAAYGDLEAKLEAAADRAASLEMLLSKVSAIRKDVPDRDIVTVAARDKPRPAGLSRGSLLRPVVGPILSDRIKEGAAELPGLTFLAQSGAQVIAPADARVLFAGRYHKEGLVLILEMADGYDLVLVGLDRIDVRPGDRLLAGEPLGTMPRGSGGSKLYFEVRENGKGVNPAPWLESDLRKARRS